MFALGCCYNQNMDDRAATKDDVEEIVGRVVGGVVGEAMQLISERFDKQDKTIEGMQKTIGDMQATLNRVENKLDATAYIVDEHTDQLRQLKHKAA